MTVTVDTSSQDGVVGSFDFNFGPGGLVTQQASLDVLNFSSDGALGGAPATMGDVIGSLPGTLTFDNGTQNNDYFQGFTFGNTVTFMVSLYGPALTAPDGTSTSGSSFSFSMFSDSAGTIPILTNDLIDGYAILVNVNLDGSVSVDNSSPYITVSDPAAVPEPPGMWFVALSVGLCAWLGIVKAQRGVGQKAAIHEPAGLSQSDIRANIVRPEPSV